MPEDDELVDSDDEEFYDKKKKPNLKVPRKRQSPDKFPSNFSRADDKVFSIVANDKHIYSRVLIGT